MAIKEIKEKSGLEGVIWEEKIYVTREMTADFFEVDEDYKVKNNIDFTTVTACGECCVGCKKKEDGICQGCIESDGHCVEWEQSNG